MSLCVDMQQKIDAFNANFEGIHGMFSTSSQKNWCLWQLKGTPFVAHVESQLPNTLSGRAHSTDMIAAGPKIPLNASLTACSFDVSVGLGCKWIPHVNH